MTYQVKIRFQNLPFKFQLAALHRGFEPHGACPSDERRPPKNIEAAKAEGYNARDAVVGRRTLNQVDP
jgi:hypothetical protein